MSVAFYAKLLCHPTVFVLGAGASQPYGFPLGRELRGLLRGIVVSGHGMNQLRALGFKDEDMRRFDNQLRLSKHGTVDRILDYVPSLRDIGAHSIALALMQLENADALFSQNDWYDHLFTGLNLDSDQASTSNLSIVSLNYDRSLECYLDRSVELTFRERDWATIHRSLSAIEIVHAHGSLGSYEEVGYGGARSNIQIKAAAESLKIVSDNLSDSPAFVRSQELIAKARNVIFIGCGYHPETITALFAKSRLTDISIYGTCFGLDIKPPDVLFGGARYFFGGKEDKTVPFLSSIDLK